LELCQVREKDRKKVIMQPESITLELETINRDDIALEEEQRAKGE